MIKIDETIIREVILHRVSSNASDSILNDNLLDFETDEEKEVFHKIFLKSFLTNSDTFEFKHDVDLSYNVLYNLAEGIYGGDDFVIKSKEIAKHLISSSKHPNIKNGEVFITKFDDIKLENKYYEGIGIYKFETKDNFIETTLENGKISYSFRKGIANKKADKACLIVFTDNPFTIFIIDSNANDTEYWQKEFIDHKPKDDDVNNTNNFLSVTKSFITSHATNDFELSKADQIDLLNRSADYFRTNESLEIAHFENNVLSDEQLIKSFRDFDEQFRVDNKLNQSANFDISAVAVKKQAKNFKSVLKLDKNFHVYIHGEKELIQQGVDSDGRKYYKLYYDQEH